MNKVYCYCCYYYCYCYISRHCHHRYDSCIKTGSVESHFNISLLARDKVTRQSTDQTVDLVYFGLYRPDVAALVKKLLKHQLTYTVGHFTVAWGASIMTLVLT